MSHPPEEWAIYSPERDDDFPRWKRWAFNALAMAVLWGSVAILVAAIWALWLHPWVVPIVAVPLLAWAFISAITHP